MTLKIIMVGSMKNAFGWKPSVTVDVDKDEITGEDLLSLIGLDRDEAKMFGFLLVNGTKVNREAAVDFIIKEGDTIKAFPKTFGG
ncbi:MAG: MoaD/ThiS family protein [Clostridiales Family XIII bacterium]|nr:MoaD/ThiS family protein [Clostridiales Family XIII bacterium]